MKKAKRHIGSGYHTFFGIELKRDPTLGYYSARWGKGADILLYQTGTKHWVAKLYVDPAGQGVEVFTTRCKTPSAALRRLEKRTESLVKDAIKMIAKHFTRLGRGLRALGVE